MLKTEICIRTCQRAPLVVTCNSDNIFANDGNDGREAEDIQEARESENESGASVS